MEEEKPQKKYSEVAKWTSPEDCEVEQTEHIPVYSDPGKKVFRGMKNVVSKIRYKKSELEDNYKQFLLTLNNQQTQLDQAKKQREDVEAQLKALGVSKVKTPEMIRMEKTLQGATLLKQLNQFQDQENNLKSQVESTQAVLDTRKKTLESAPKA